MVHYTVFVYRAVAGTLCDVCTFLELEGLLEDFDDGMIGFNLISLFYKEMWAYSISLHAHPSC